MEAWQQRVKDEKSELDDKIRRLTNWLNVEHVEKDMHTLQLMEAQLMSMRTYSGILGLRIARFT